ncbi:MAG: DUF3617 domain-containing protein [Steroidobacteraceae bacterium]
MRRAAFTVSAATLLLTIASAADPPPLQEGLWEIRGQSIDNPGGKKSEFTYRLCRNHAYDKAMDAMVKNVKDCTTAFDSLGDGRYSSESRCTIDGTVIESKGTYTYLSATSTRSESHATYTPAYRGKTDETVIQDQNYVGACPAGMRPGDRITVEGTLQRYGR